MHIKNTTDWKNLAKRHFVKFVNLDIHIVTHCLLLATLCMSRFMVVLTYNHGSTMVYTIEARDA